MIHNLLFPNIIIHTFKIDGKNKNVFLCAENKIKDIRIKDQLTHHIIVQSFHRSSANPLKIYYNLMFCFDFFFVAAVELLLHFDTWQKVDQAETISHQELNLSAKSNTINLS